MPSKVNTVAEVAFYAGVAILVAGYVVNVQVLITQAGCAAVVVGGITSIVIFLKGIKGNPTH
jgi:hypothetical protein